MGQEKRKQKTSIQERANLQHSILMPLPIQNLRIRRHEEWLRKNMAASVIHTTKLPPQNNRGLRIVF